LEIPVQGQPDPFIWGVWVSLSKSSFHQFVESFDTAKRSHIGSFFGWLSAELPLYPSTENLKVRMHHRDDGVRLTSNWNRRTIRSPWSNDAG
ncbi:MAG: DUF2199 domain-containing protein, partial [Xanthobacteraceae bacterium]|nr:DUF2199 domain-containing protein [Xanthobacteraceae bacterium]